MVESMAALSRSPAGLSGSDGLDPSVLAAMREVPRHELVLVSGNGGTLNWHSTMVLAA